MSYSNLSIAMINLRQIMEDSEEHNPNADDKTLYSVVQIHLQSALHLMRKLYHRDNMRKIQAAQDDSHDTGEEDGDQEESADSKDHKGQGT